VSFAGAVWSEHMELDLTSEQELLRETAARFIDATCPLPVVRQLIGSETGLPEDYLRAAGELGWFAMLVPDELGGGTVSGAGLPDLAIVAEERGRALQPGPFVDMNVVATALAAGGSPEYLTDALPEIRDGQAVAAWIPGEGATGLTSNASVTATSRGVDFVLTGRAGPVLAAAQADWLLVSAAGTADGMTQFMVGATTPGVTVAPLDALDVTQRYASVSFDDVVVPAASVIGHVGGSEPDVERQLHLACVLLTAETIGAMDALFDLTRRYAIDRTAFGRPIGSFQAVKHLLADMSLLIEAGKAVAAAAVRAVQERWDQASDVVSMAKSWVADAGVDVVQGCAQVHAGIGFTWEHDLHLFLRRITMNGLLFGASDWHRERICRTNGL
jgi:alkylation response protein AidB-like acyl-CoA dehydrogenase